MEIPSPSARSLPRVCVIGAGSSGIAVAKALADASVPFEVLEKSDRVGGNWAFQNPNGMSSAYRSLHINTSRDRMAYADFPMPRDYPDFPHHSLVARYFDAYVDRFALREKIRFRCGAARVERGDGGFRVTRDDGVVDRFDVVVVANGHHWDPSWPEPRFAGEFGGAVMHSHFYVDPETPHDLRGKRVVVLGMGNSAMDIASELSRPGVAARVFLAARRGAWVIPNYLYGKPIDQQLPFPTWVPFSIKRAVGEAMLRVAVGSMERYGLPRPDHRLGEAHPTISSDLLPRLGRGDIVAKPNIERLEGNRVRFVDGSVEDVDAIVYATGYKVTFPFFDRAFLSAPNNELPLFFRAFAPREPGVFFAALLQPLGATMPLAEAQGKWLASHLTGRYMLPDPSAMEARISADDAAMRRRYVASKRHTMQVDFDEYLAALAAERRAGERRAERAGFPLPFPGLAEPLGG